MSTDSNPYEYVELYEDGFDLDEVSKTIPLNMEISRILGKVDNRGKMNSKEPGFGAINKAWEKIGGVKAAKETRSIYVDEDSLIITLKSPVWAQELSLFAPQYAKMFNNELEIDSIKEIKFRVK